MFQNEHYCVKLKKKKKLSEKKVKNIISETDDYSKTCTTLIFNEILYKIKTRVGYNTNKQKQTKLSVRI